MEDSSTVAKVSMLRYISLNVALPFLLFLLFILIGYIINGLNHNYQNKKAEISKLSKILANSATDNDPDLIISQVNLSMLQYPSVEDIQFYSIEHAIGLEADAHDDWRDALFNQSVSYHEEVLVDLQDKQERRDEPRSDDSLHEELQNHSHPHSHDDSHESSSSHVSSSDTALIGYINITLDLQELRREWFERHTMAIIILVALFPLILLLIYLRLLSPFRALTNMANNAKVLVQQEDMVLEPFIYSDKEFDEIESIKQLVAKLDKRYKALLEEYTQLNEKGMTASHKQSNNQNSNNLQSMIIHELKSSLNDMSDGLKMIGRSYLSEVQAKAIAIIREGNSELDFTLNQIIQLDRIEKGQLGVSYSELQPAQMINSTIQTFEDRAAKKHLTLKANVHHIDHILAGDVKKIQTILNELLLNAIEYTESGGVNVDSSMMYFVDSIRWTIKVSDTGIGIESKYLDDIFLPFFQMDASRKKGHEGSSVGLGIARKLTELLGGSLTVESEFGVGTTFTLILQLRSWHDSELFILLKGIKIAALESESSASYIQDLEKYSADVDVFTDSFELMEQLLNKHSDVLLISDEISVNTVVKLCQLIREQQTAHRILIVWYQAEITASELAELEAIGLDYVLNPTSPQQFQVNQIRNWIMG